MDDIKSRDQIIEDLSNRVDGLEAEVGRLREKATQAVELRDMCLKENENLYSQIDYLSSLRTWEQERAAVVALIENKIEHMHKIDRLYFGDSFCSLLKRLKRGEHWPEGENLSEVPDDECGCDDRFYCSACQEFYLPNATTYLRHEPLCDGTTTKRIVCENCRVKGHIERGEHWPKGEKNE